MSQEEERRRAWHRDGFFVVPRLVSREEVEQLTHACDHVLAQVRKASTATGHSTTHISRLLAREYFEDRPEALTRFADFTSSAKVIALIHDLGRAGEGPLNLRDTHYFHEPARDYDGDWHRDGDGAAPLTSEAIANRPTQLRFRIALAQEDHLEYVPGSHARLDTPEEERLRKGAVRNAPLSHGQTRITLLPGDVCVFNVWGIHRAHYRSDHARKTLDLLFGFGPRKSVFQDDVLALAASIQRARIPGAR